MSLRRPRVVLDAGVLISALLRPEGPPGGLLRLLVERRAFELVMSRAIMVELQTALSDADVQRHLRAGAEQLERWSVAIGVLATHVDASQALAGPTLQAIESVAATVANDPADDKYLAAAVASGAEVIITSDPHLLGLDPVQGIQIVTPKMFLEVLELAGERAG